MDIFVQEHGEAVHRTVIGIIVLTMIIVSIKMLSIMMPVFCVTSSKDSRDILEKIKESTPKIEAEDVIYADYEDRNFNILDYIVVRDWDGKLIKDHIEVNGNIDISKKGLYPVKIKVTNQKKYTASVQVNVIVE